MGRLITQIVLTICNKSLNNFSRIYINIWFYQLSNRSVGKTHIQAHGNTHTQVTVISSATADLKKSNPHTGSAGSGLVLTPYLWTPGKCVTEQQKCSANEVSKFINLIPNHHIVMTRFNAHDRFRIDCVIGWNQCWKRRPSTVV